MSAGHAHSAVVTTDGELYCWSNNRGGCCGQPLVVRSVIVIPSEFNKGFRANHVIYLTQKYITCGGGVGIITHLPQYKAAAN